MDQGRQEEKYTARTRHSAGAGRLWLSSAKPKEGEPIFLCVKDSVEAMAHRAAELRDATNEATRGAIHRAQEAYHSAGPKAPILEVRENVDPAEAARRNAEGLAQKVQDQRTRAGLHKMEGLQPSDKEHAHNLSI